MAASTITNAELTRNSFAAFPTAAAVAANDGLVVDYSKGDQKILLVVTNTDTENTQTVVVNGGDSFFGGNDIEYSIGAEDTAVVCIDSGGYKNISGDNAGKVLIKSKSTTDTSITVAAIVLP